MSNRKTALFLALIMITVLLLTACGGKTAVGGSTPKAITPDNAGEPAGDGRNSDGDTQEPEPEPQPAKQETQVKITETAAKATETELYETADFSITIPKGWKVTTGGANINSYIYVTDPDEPRNGIFIILKMEPLLHCQAGKDAWQTLYNNGDKMVALFADAPVLENPSTEGFFKLFYDDFTVTERFEASTGFGAVSLGEEVLRATFTEPTGEAEGIVTASIVDFGSFQISDGTLVGYQLQTVDGGYYMAYNIMGVMAVKDTLIEWEDILTQCLASLQYTDSFINATNQASDDQLAVSRQISQNFNQAMDGLMDSWERRNRSFDIMSQKQSDAILGYERVYNTDTNEIYKATNGFYDEYDGSTYMEVTDDNMYAQPISGYIERID